MATIDAQLIAIDSVTGRPIWQTEVGDPAQGYAMTAAPLVVEDKVIVGVAGGEYGIRGYVAAYDAATGEEAWRFYTIPGPGEPGHDTWEGDSWRHGGAPVWLTGSYDPELNLTYWGIGNPGPDWNPEQRRGDNLYSDCVVALDADTGALRWYFQFTPNDAYDFDAVQTPVLVDLETEDNRVIKAMFWANRNGFFYALDRVTGRFLNSRPFVTVNWAEGFDDSGRPIQTPQPPDAVTFPGVLRWHELVLAVLQSGNGAVLSVCLGELRVGVYPHGRPRRIPRRATVSGRQAVATDSGRRRASGASTRARQSMDRGDGDRGGDCARPAHRATAMEVRNERRDDKRHLDHGIAHVVHGRSRGILLRVRRA